MTAQKVGIDQIGRQYLEASNLEMARLIMGRTGIYRGTGLELAAGIGYLGFALAENTMLDMYLLENNRDTIKQAENHIARSNMKDRVRVLKGSICDIPLKDGSVDLVTSRKSVFGWSNRQKIFREVYRVLAPGGVACFCGGFESGDVRFQLNARLAEFDPKLPGQLHGQVHWNHLHNFEKILKAAGIGVFEIKCRDNGMWILFGKPAPQAAIRGPLHFSYLGPPREQPGHEAASL
jgi:SAM-dependent methyltransferase